MSEDGGHSDDGTDDSEEDAEHEEVLVVLLRPLYPEYSLNLNFYDKALL